MKNLNKISTVSCIVVAGLTLSSCELIGPRQKQLIPLVPVNQQKGSEEVFSQLQNKPLTPEKRPPAELYPGTDRAIGNPSSQNKVVKSNNKDLYTFNFDEADLGEVAKVILGDTLKQNYVLSPKVVGKVTLQTTQPLSTDELLPTLEMVLRMNNAALVKDGKVYHIEPVADALFTSDLTTSGSKNGYQTRVIPVKNVAVDDLVEVIKPLVQEKTILSVNNSRNLLVASGTPDEMTRVLDMVDTFDIDLLNGRSFGLYPLVHVEPDTIIDELEAVFYKKEKDSDFFKFIPIERLNSVLAITHQAKYLHDIENWVFRLDKANTATGGGVNVYKVQHANAEELADTLNEIFTGAQSSDKSASLAPGKKSAEASNKSSTTSSSNTASAGNSSSSAGGAAGSSSSSSSRKKTTRKSGSGSSGSSDVKVANVDDVRIIADKVNNSIVTVSTPREYEVILPIIKQLDIMPLQVLIDATIVSVDLKDDLQYGIQWKLNHQNSAVGSGTTAPTLGQAATALGGGTANIAGGGLGVLYNSGAINALLAAQAQKNNINIISSPSLMVLNNQEATIEVGQQIPVLTGSLSGVSTASSSGLVTSNQIQYKDVGVKLEVTPRVNANGMVIMDIKQTVSDVDSSSFGDTKSSSINKKEIDSSVAVHDSETIVLGGLIKETNTFNKGGIPLLHQMPWVGPLFGNTQNNKDKTELVILITPRVVKNKQDSRLISDEFKRKLTGIYQQFPATDINKKQ